MHDVTEIHTQLATMSNFRKIKPFPIPYGLPVTKDEDVQVNTGHMGRKAFPYFSCRYALINFMFRKRRPMQLDKIIDLLSLQVWHAVYEFLFYCSIKFCSYGILVTSTCTKNKTRLKVYFSRENLNSTFSASCLKVNLQ